MCVCVCVSACLCQCVHACVWGVGVGGWCAVCLLRGKRGRREEGREGGADTVILKRSSLLAGPIRHAGLLLATVVDVGFPPCQLGPSGVRNQVGQVA